VAWAAFCQLEAEVEALRLLFRGWKAKFETLVGGESSSEPQHRQAVEVLLQAEEEELQVVSGRLLRVKVVQQLEEVVSTRFEMWAPDPSRMLQS
jgi:hypothetical protein